MRSGLAVSVAGHTLLIAWGLFSLPAPSPLNATEIEAIPVDFVEIRDGTSLPKGLQTAALVEKVTPPEPAKKPEEPPPLPKPTPAKPEPPPPPPVPEPPAPQPAPEPAAAPAATLPAEQQAAAPDEPAAAPPLDRVPEPRLRPKPPKPAPEITKKPKDKEFDVDQITAMLDKPSSPASQTPPDLPAAFGTASGSPDAKMTESELDALRARLAQCWSPPLGWTDPSEVRVVLMVHLNADGSVNGAPQVVEAPGGRYAQLAPESAARAVRRCAPYILPPEKYDTWKQVRVTFDPTDMSGV
ncbi:MAG: hypothetical protein WD036_06625 [Bauldia sp.]